MDEKIAKLNAKLKKITGNDPISRARREALMMAIYELMNGEAQA